MTGRNGHTGDVASGVVLALLSATTSFSEGDGSPSFFHLKSLSSQRVNGLSLAPSLLCFFEPKLLEYLTKSVIDVGASL